MRYLEAAASIRPADEASMALARARQEELTKPPGSLGRLEETSIRLAGMARSCPPPVPRRKSILLFAGDHGVVAQGVSAYPSEVTAQMVANILSGGAAISVLSRRIGARLVVVDAGVAADLPPLEGLRRAKIARGTRDMSVGSAMSREQAEAALDLGVTVAREEIDRGANIIACGEMGIGNTTPATAIVALLTGRSPADIAGPGTGLAARGVSRKAEVIVRALDANRPDPTDGVDLLRTVGGFEIGAMAGAMLAAAARGLPVLLDGLIATSAALTAAVIAPRLRDYLIAAHLSPEPAHAVALAWLGAKPLLDMGMRLGEGTGAALAFDIVEASALILAEMATFAQAGVSGASGR